MVAFSLSGKPPSDIAAGRFEDLCRIDKLF
jgi:hypothetical protein